MRAKYAHFFAQDDSFLSMRISKTRHWKAGSRNSAGPETRATAALESGATFSAIRG